MYITVTQFGIYYIRYIYIYKIININIYLKSNYINTLNYYLINYNNY